MCPVLALTQPFWKPWHSPCSTSLTMLLTMYKTEQPPASLQSQATALAGIISSVVCCNPPLCAFLFCPATACTSQGCKLRAPFCSFLRCAAFGRCAWLGAHCTFALRQPGDAQRSRGTTALRSLRMSRRARTLADSYQLWLCTDCTLARHLRTHSARKEQLHPAFSGWDNGKSKSVGLLVWHSLNTRSPAGRRATFVRNNCSPLSRDVEKSKNIGGLLRAFRLVLNARSLPA